MTGHELVLLACLASGGQGHWEAYQRCVKKLAECCEKEWVPNGALTVIKCVEKVETFKNK